MNNTRDQRMRARKRARREKECADDCEIMTATELRRKYSSEANSHKNMKQRAPAHWHDDWDDFRDFLRDMGPKPEPEFTLDRIDNDDPEYGPGKCRWADKKDQSANRHNTVKIPDPEDGKEKPLTAIAAIYGTPESTLRSRLAKGWNAHDVVHGRKRQKSDPDAPDNPWGERPWPEKVYDTWEKRWLELEPQTPPWMFYLSFLREQRDMNMSILNEQIRLDQDLDPDADRRVDHIDQRLEDAKSPYSDWLKRMDEYREYAVLKKSKKAVRDGERHFERTGRAIRKRTTAYQKENPSWNDEDE